jgi:predicted membrane protein
MNQIRRSRLNGRAIAGIVLILLGVAFILDNFGLIDAGRIWDYWPLFLVVAGFGRLMHPRRQGPDQLWGLFLIALGAVFLARNLGIFWISFHRIWPVALVFLGVVMIWQAFSRGGKPPEGPVSSSAIGDRAAEGFAAGFEATRGLRETSTVTDSVDEFAMFGGGNRRVRTSNFRGGTVTAIAGGFDIDLREAAMAGPSATIEVFFLMGGMTLRVPESWSVAVNVTPLFGGTDNKTRVQPPADGPPKTLTITGTLIMGGIEIKN